MGYVLGGLGALGWSGIRSVWKEVREGEMAQKMEDTGNVKGVKGGEVNKGSGKARVSLLFCEAVTVTNWTGLEPRNS